MWFINTTIILIQMTAAYLHTIIYKNDKFILLIYDRSKFVLINFKLIYILYYKYKSDL